MREALGPLVARCPDAEAILRLRVVDPAMGCGNFLGEAGRFLAERYVAAGGPGDPPAARRLVAERCLFGVDRDPAAVALGLRLVGAELGADLGGRLVHGDALAGPPWPRLGERPGDRRPLPPAVVAGLERRRQAGQAGLRLLAAAWAGAVRLGAGRDGDDDYEALARAVAAGEEDAVVAAGRPGLAEQLAAGADALPFELAFPDVFRDGGFDAVLGNPPWEAIRRDDDGFFAGGRSRGRGQAGRRERLADPAWQGRYDEYRRLLRQEDRVAARLFSRHRQRLPDGDAGRGGERLAGRGTYDAWMLFVELGHRLLKPAAGATLGLLLPGAFHSSEGAAGMRKLLLDELALRCCYSFENRHRPPLFAIDSRFKFAVVVAERRDGPPPERIPCAFYRRDPAWLADPADRLLYPRPLLDAAGGPGRTFLELRSPAELTVAERLYAPGRLRFGERCRQLGIRLGQEVNMTYDASAFVAAESIIPGLDGRDPAVRARLLQAGYLPLHEGKTLHQYDDRWGAPPRYLVPVAYAAARSGWLEATRHPRLAFRAVASATNERTAIFCLVPAGFLLGNSAPGERQPGSRPRAAALLILAIANSFTFDWVLRQRASANVNLFILDRCPLPTLSARCERFLIAAAGRLSEGRLDDPERQELRLSVDAVVASGYGLERDEYRHVLGSFSHRSDGTAPARCLALFDDLAADRPAFLARLPAEGA